MNSICTHIVDDWLVNDSKLLVKKLVVCANFLEIKGNKLQIKSEFSIMLGVGSWNILCQFVCIFINTKVCPSNYCKKCRILVLISFF